MIPPESCIDRLLRSLLSLGLGFILLAGVLLVALLPVEPGQLRLSVVGHLAEIPADSSLLRLGRSPAADLRLLDRLVDGEVHGELRREESGHEVPGSAGRWFVWNRSITQRLAVDGIEITERWLEVGDRLRIFVPDPSEDAKGLQRLLLKASPKPAPGLREAEIVIGSSTPWGRLWEGRPLPRQSFLQEAESHRKMILDPLAVRRFGDGWLFPVAENFFWVSPEKGRRLMEPGAKLDHGGKEWVFGTRLEGLDRLMAERPELELRLGSGRFPFVFGKKNLSLGDWGRLKRIGARLRYRDLGRLAGMEIALNGRGTVVPGMAAVKEGSTVKLGRTRYRFLLEGQRVRLEIQPKGTSRLLDSLPLVGSFLGKLFPGYYDSAYSLGEGPVHLSTGRLGEVGESDVFLRSAKRWQDRSLALLTTSGGEVRVRSLGGVKLRLRRRSGESVDLPNRSSLKSYGDLQLWQRGEIMLVGERLEGAGLVLELRWPDERGVSVVFVLGLALLLLVAQLLFFMFHRPAGLRLLDLTKPVYGLDPSTGRVRVVGERAGLLSIGVPRLLLPICGALTLLGMSMLLHFGVEPDLLGSPDFFARQAVALFLGLMLFFWLALRRRGRVQADGGTAASGFWGIDWAIWLGILSLLLTTILTLARIGSRHNGFFFRVPVIGVTLKFSEFAKIFFSVGFARMFARGLQTARGGDNLGIEDHRLNWRRLLFPKRHHKSSTGEALLYVLRKIVLLAILLGVIFGLYVLQNDLGPGLIFTLTLALFLAFVMGQYNRGLRGFGLHAGPQFFLFFLVLGVMLLWLALPVELKAWDGPVGSVVAPILDKIVERLNLWWEPWRFTRGDQVVQSLWTVSGVAGELRYFPNLHSDFAFSALVHRYGVAVGYGVLLAYVAFFVNGLALSRALYREAVRQGSTLLYEDSFTVLLGCLVLVAEAAIHIGACLNLTPLTGVNLPFVSSGGTSLITSYGLLGVICSRLSR